MKFFKRKPVEQNLSVGNNLRNFRLLGDEAEILGNRMDHARKIAANSTTEWSRNYWTQILEQLLFQWRQLPILHDGDAQVSIIPRWNVDYEFYETSNPSEYVGVSDRAYQKLFRENIDLETSWHNHREQRLAKAQ